MTAVQTTTTDTAAPAGGHIIINGRKAVHIPLETAIERKGETITAVHLMKPLAGAAVASGAMLPAKPFQRVA